MEYIKMIKNSNIFLKLGMFILFPCLFICAIFPIVGLFRMDIVKLIIVPMAFLPIGALLLGIGMMIFLND